MDVPVPDVAAGAPYFGFFSGLDMCHTWKCIVSVQSTFVAKTCFLMLVGCIDVSYMRHFIISFLTAEGITRQCPLGTS